MSQFDFVRLLSRYWIARPKSLMHIAAQFHPAGVASKDAFAKNHRPSAIWAVHCNTYFVTRPMYFPSSVSILITSPLLMNDGT